MKKQKIFGRILFPVMISLLLLIPLSCLIFYWTARQYTYNEAVEELTEMQNRIVPIMEKSFISERDEVKKESQTDSVKFFLEQAGPLASQLGGNARLIVLAGKMQLVYPRNELLRAEVAPLAEELTSHIQNSDFPENSTFTFESSNGETYMLSIYKTPVQSQRLKYIITYCPTSQIGIWVKRAAIYVLTISTIFGILTFAVLWIAVRSITQPLLRLCQEAERIGNGSFTEIHSVFSLNELENLRFAMNKMSKQLKRADQSQKNFFQNVSHELRNPLMSISGYAQGIEKGIFPNSREAAHTILVESLRLTEVVNSLLTLSRLENIQQEVTLEKIKVGEIIEDCLDRMNGLAVQKEISLVLSPFSENITAYGEEELLVQVLENLLANAIRYAKTMVTVNVHAEEKFVSISVSDDGEGIDEKDLPYLFERCYKGKGGHFGIGLAIAHSATDRMDGRLYAKNNSDSGAIFTLLLHSTEFLENT